TLHFPRISGRSQISQSPAKFEIATVKYSQTITNISSEVNSEKGFKLYQNYPNPFNPSTNLEFACPPARQGISPASLQGGELRFVSLKVYDALGNEVKILVNENKSAGIYKVEFNGSSLPSGVYFYKLETQDFTDTKSMILLK
ncbi:MAG: T9SS type A sorting domain-containing protein, partial [Ignavibacteria bacterium]|nr:T9SS type A sorting domain-containing protein [Ignavibacteria bacterium]